MKTGKHRRARNRRGFPAKVGPLQGEEWGTECAEKSMVAELPRSAIDSMTPEELIRIIHAARLPPACSDVALELLDVDELRQLACLARKCCQTETDHA